MQQNIDSFLHQTNISKSESQQGTVQQVLSLAQQSVLTCRGWVLLWALSNVTYAPSKAHT